MPSAAVSGAAVGGYAFAGEHPVAKWTSAGWEYYLQDAMGSVIGMASASGASTATITLDPQPDNKVEGSEEVTLTLEDGRLTDGGATTRRAA